MSGIAGNSRSSARLWLHVWEQCQMHGSVQRALLLLAGAEPQSPVETLATLSIGQRNRRLLALRESLFGPGFVGLATCPQCGERIEMTFAASEISQAMASIQRSDAGITGSPEVDSEGGEHGATTPSSLVAIEDRYLWSDSSFEVIYRLPTSQDLMALDPAHGSGARRKQLLDRCILESRSDGVNVAPDQLPSEVSAAVVAHMAAVDPFALMETDLICSACEYRWPVQFDILSFLWDELNAWAERMLNEVHTLASAYGWSEMEILDMGPWRRGRYISMVLDRGAVT
ncbi:MAG: phage baseplate protein [Chloroflexota bacterium]|nr:phage baseplate protein [Chloroflexota bacterium]